MKKIKWVGLFCFLFCIHPSFAKTNFFSPKFSKESFGESLKEKNIFSDSLTTLTDSLYLKKKKKWIAAVLAFPIPFGIFGLHRWYLGTSKGMPLLYIATFGGGFGTLPFIDFVVIMIDNDMARYTNNPKLFMWGKRKKKITQ